MVKHVRSAFAVSSATALLFVPLLASRCGTSAPSDTTATATAEGGVPVRARPEVLSTELFAKNLDATTSPAKDFFQYANGGWIAHNPIPSSESRWWIGNLVQEELYAVKRDLCERAAKADGPKGSDLQKIGDFWTVAMDVAKADADGVAPLHELLAKIDAVATPADVVTLAAELQRDGVDVLWSFGVEQDEKQSDVIAVHAGQGGLGLPDRDYYFNKEEGVAKVRAAYPLHVARMLELLGQTKEASAKAGAAVLDFETALATASRSLADLRDPEKNYNKTTVADLEAKTTPHVKWRAMLDGYGLKGADTVIVGQPEFFAAIDELLQTTPIATLREYLRFHTVGTFAPFLATAFDRERFDFYGRTLQGAKEQRPRWKRVLDQQERAMGMVVGKVFVKERFPEHTKRRYSELVEAIRTAYREHIEKLDWMSAETKRKALDKLAKVVKKVGYPDHWKDMSSLAFDRASYAGNMLRAAQWHFDDDVHKFGKPVDRTEWDMTPQTYNAYYNPSNNEIVLPAAQFVVPGLADDDCDDALVYGYAAASTIGHEITHGFDDEGRKFDADGNLSDWWSKEDSDAFNQRADRLAKEFDAYEPIPGLHINGEASLGENIADLGGVVLGLDAFKKTEQYRKGEKIGGWTPLQRFFLAYAFSWLGHQREEILRQGLLSDVHSPMKWRVLGPLSNVPEFFEAFGVKKGDPMWRDPADRVRIW